MQLLADVLEQTLIEPQCAKRWHSLFDLWSKTAATDQRQRVLDRLAVHELDDPRADVLRLTLLAWTSGDARFVEAAAARTLGIAPLNPDRVAAFASFYSLQALQFQASRTEFVAALEVARLPAMAAHLAQSAVSTLPPAFTPRVPRTIERVAVVVPHIGNAMHTPTVLAVHQCELLARSGREVRIYSCQELWPPDMPLFHGCGGGANLPGPDGEHWQRALPQGVTMSVSDPRFSLRSRWLGLLPAVADFDPDVVLFVGLYSPLAGALHAVRPVVGLCTNAVPPLAPVDVWLSADEATCGTTREIWNGAFPDPLACFHPQRIKVTKGPFALKRSDIGLAQHAQVWVTVGFRLEQEVSAAWATRMLETLARHPNAVWLLVGCNNGVAPTSLQRAPPGRVVALAPRPDVPAILSLCDVYVNPPRIGGGFSVLEAMASGLPIVSFANSDGGDKVGDLAVADDDAYFRRIAELCARPELRTAMGSRMRERFLRRFDLEGSGPRLLAACELAANCAQERLSRSSGAIAATTASD